MLAIFLRRFKLFGQHCLRRNVELWIGVDQLSPLTDDGGRAHTRASRQLAKKTPRLLSYANLGPGVYFDALEVKMLLEKVLKFLALLYIHDHCLIAYIKFHLGTKSCFQFIWNQLYEINFRQTMFSLRVFLKNWLMGLELDAGMYSVWFSFVDPAGHDFASRTAWQSVRQR